MFDRWQTANQTMSHAMQSEIPPAANITGRERLHGPFTTRSLNKLKVLVHLKVEEELGVHKSWEMKNWFGMYTFMLL